MKRSTPGSNDPSQRVHKTRRISKEKNKAVETQVIWPEYFNSVCILLVTTVDGANSRVAVCCLFAVYPLAHLSFTLVPFQVFKVYYCRKVAISRLTYI